MSEQGGEVPIPAPAIVIDRAAALGLAIVQPLVRERAEGRELLDLLRSNPLEARPVGLDV